ncbi:MAG: hypothetical protein NZ930_06775 [Candidatus Bipolaricaulota bacterium]|nr:hypothetical protein [Candidatus Bipolaricaulota bacterium]MDW8031767.1 hypothetical protein [Candidatus Bipolaricaulota bacterium]
MRGLLGVGLVFSVFVIALPIAAAPISGEASLNLVLRSATCGIDADGDTFVDEDPPNNLDDDGDTLIDEDDCSKVDLSALKFESDVVVTLSISGLEIASTSVFTFKGLEYQAFSFLLNIGALSFSDYIVFAPSVTEIALIRNASSLSARYCILDSAPGSVSPPFRSCPLFDSRLYWLLEGDGFYHPTVANLILAQIFDDGGMLQPNTLTLRKKVADLAVKLGGITVSTRALFTNFGNAGDPNFRVGVVLGLEGQTVSGILIRSETWIGARQGLECFAECKLLERLYLGAVTDEFSFQEEKLFVRNVKLWGVTLHFLLEVGSACAADFLCYAEINTIIPVQPLGLVFNNTLRFGPGISEHFDVLNTTLRVGDAAIVALWYFYPHTGSWKAHLARLIGSFDPPGLTVSSDLHLCAGTANLFCAHGVAKHTLSLAAAIGTLSLDIRLIFIGLIKNFYQLWLDAVWKLGPVELYGSVVLSVRYLSALAVGVTVKF